MKHRIEVPEDLDVLIRELQGLSWEADGIEDALLGVKELSLEAEYMAGGLVKVTCQVTVFPKDFVGSTSTSWVDSLSPADLLREAFSYLLGKSTDDPPFNRVTEVRYLRAPDTEEAISIFITGHLLPLLERAASL